MLENKADYVRIQTNAMGTGAYEFYFTKPPLLVDDAPKPTVSLPRGGSIPHGRSWRYLTRSTSRQPPSGMLTFASTYLNATSSTCSWLLRGQPLLGLESANEF